MGMFHNLIRLPGAELAGLLADPAGIIAFLGRFKGCDPNPRRIDIDKAWHGLQIVLALDPALGYVSGTDPITWAIHGQRKIGWITTGYGPAACLSPEEVALVHGAIKGVDDAAFRQRFNAMKEALCQAHGLNDADEDDYEYLAHHFAAVQAFYAAAMQAGDAIVMHTF